MSSLTRYCFLLLLVLLGLFLPIQNQAQQADEKINLKNFNDKLLEHLIKQKVDSVRKSHNLLPLMCDETLYKAANNHVLFLNKHNKLDHEQIIPRQATPQKRAKKFGSQAEQVAEILSMVYIHPAPEENPNKLPVVQSYQQAASAIINRLCKQLPNYVHLISRGYRIMGIAVFANEQTRACRAVMLFAPANHNYEYKPNKAFFPYDLKSGPALAKQYTELPPQKAVSQYSWGLKAQKTSWLAWLDTQKKCEEMNNRFKRIRDVKLKQNDKNVYFIEFDDYTKVKNLFDKKHDGLALEIIPHSLYDCSKPDYYSLPGRRNKLSVFSGTVLQPIYRDQIKKYGRRAKDKSYTVPLGRVPDSLIQAPYEVNVAFIARRSVCHSMYFAGVCGKIFSYKPAPFPLYNQIGNISVPDPTLEPDTLIVWAHFQQGGTDYQATEIQPALERVTEKNLRVLSAAVEAYASVEGTPEINQRLFTERAARIVQAFAAKQDSAIEMTVSTRENWEMFFEQLHQPENKNYHFLLKKDTAAIRTYVNTPTNTRALEPLLSKQRYAQVKLITQPKVTEATRNTYLVKSYEEWLTNISELNQKINKTKNSQDRKKLQKEKEKALNRLENTQVYLYNRYLNKKISLDSINALDKPKHNNDFINLHYNQLVLDYKYLKNKDDKAYFEGLKTLMEQSPDNPMIIYNYWAFLLNNHQDETYAKQINFADLHKALGILDQSAINPELTNRLWLYYHHRYCELKYIEQDFAGAANSLEFLRKHYDNETTNDPVRLKMARYFINFKLYSWTEDMLKPLIFRADPYYDAIPFYLEFKYSDMRSSHTSDFYYELINARAILSKTDWCNLFEGNCRINKQILDYEPLWLFYCKNCH